MTLKRDELCHHQKLPASIVMSPEDLVDAALAGLDRGEVARPTPRGNERECHRAGEVLARSSRCRAPDGSTPNW